jgi:hypothetical protein
MTHPRAVVALKVVDPQVLHALQALQALQVVVLPVVALQDLPVLQEEVVVSLLGFPVDLHSWFPLLWLQVNLFKERSWIPGASITVVSMRRPHHLSMWRPSIGTI